MAAQQETKFNTSFIPKKTTGTSSRRGGTTGEPFGKKGASLFGTIGLFIFLISLLAAGGVYGWTYKIKDDIGKQLETLQLARGQFDERTIAEATRLNKRISAVRKLLDNHIASSAIFAILEKQTLHTVGFNSFQYASQDDGTISISGSGEAASYESVVLQSDKMGNSDFRDVLFDNVQPSSDGEGVGFSMGAAIGENIVLYKNHVDQVFNQHEEGDRGDEEDDSENDDIVSFNNLFR